MPPRIPKKTWVRHDKVERRQPRQKNRKGPSLTDLAKNLLFSKVATTARPQASVSDLLMEGKSYFIKESRFEHSAPETPPSKFEEAGPGKPRIARFSMLLNPATGERKTVRLQVDEASARKAEKRDKGHFFTEKGEKRLAKWHGKRRQAVNRAVESFTQRKDPLERNLFFLGERLAGTVIDALGLKERNLGSEIVLKIPGHGPEIGSRDLVLYGRDEHKNRASVSVEVLKGLTPKQANKFLYAANKNVQVVDVRNITPDSVAGKGPEAVRKYVAEKFASLTAKKDFLGVKELEDKIIKDARLEFNLIITPFIDPAVSDFLGIHHVKKSGFEPRNHVQIDRLAGRWQALTPEERKRARGGVSGDPLQSKMGALRESLQRTAIAVTDYDGRKIKQIIAFEPHGKHLRPVIVDERTWKDSIHEFPSVLNAYSRRGLKHQFADWTRQSKEKKAGDARAVLELSPWGHDAKRVEAEFMAPYMPPESVKSTLQGIEERGQRVSAAYNKKVEQARKKREKEKKKRATELRYLEERERAGTLTARSRQRLTRARRQNR